MSQTWTRNRAWLYNACPYICGCQGSVYNNRDDCTLWEWLNAENQLLLCNLNYIDIQLYVVGNNIHIKTEVFWPDPIKHACGG